MAKSEEAISRLGIKGVLPAEQMKGGDAQDSKLLAQMLEEAETYVSAYPWCRSVREAYFGDGFGGIVAVFLLRIEPVPPSLDEWIWVVVGDVPSAYLQVHRLKNPYEVLCEYVRDKARWVEFAARGEVPPEDILPVAVIPPTPYWANEVEERLDTIREHFLEHFRKS